MRNRSAVILVAVLVSAFVAASCGGLEPPQQGTSPDRNSINAFLSGLGELPVGQEGEVPTGPSEPTDPPSFIVDDPDAPSKHVQYNCTTTPYSMSANPDKIVTLNPDVGKLWLGSLLQGSGYARGLGSLKALPIGNRAPLKVYMDLLNPSVSRTVENPDAASMQEAIGSLATDAQKNGEDIPTNAAFQHESASTTKQGMLTLGFSAKYLGAKAFGNLDVSKDVKTSTVMAALQQRYFTASFVTPPTPADYFTTDATISDFREQQDFGRVGIGNPPVVVSSISYGRTFIMTVSSQATEDKLSAAVGAAFSGATVEGKVDMTAEQKSIIENSKFDLISIGGSEQDFLQAVKSHSIDSFLDKPSKITDARPISYQVDNISEGSAAAFTETANYNNTTCHAQAGHQETVGSIVKLTNLRVYAARCNQNVYGDILINGYPVAHMKDEDPYLKLREHNVQALPTQPAAPPNSGWPQFSPPDTETYNLQGVQFPPDGYYLTDFDQPPTTAEFNIQGGLNNAIFPFRDDTANTYRATEISPFTTGSKTLQGNSAHCPLDLSYEIQKVANLVIDVP